MRPPRSVLVEIDGADPVVEGVARGACLECGADVPYARTAPLGRAVPVYCPECKFELELRRIGPGRAAVRRPYGCRRFADVESSNLAAAGARDGYLVVRFRSGGVYRYAGGAELLPRLLTADSAGRFFHREVRGRLRGERLCAVYGCFRPVSPTGRVMCDVCLGREPTD